MITREFLEAAPLWAIIKGKPQNPGPVPWALFDPQDATDVLAGRFRQLGYRFTDAGGHHPEVVDEDNPPEPGYPHGRYDDLDAALAYLRCGGSLIKTPKGGKAWRLYAVKRLRGKKH
jgi:hypothetical protein